VLIYSLAELEKSRTAWERGGGRRWGWGQEGEMTQTMYTHVNKWIKINK
jgi:hypothetical protein